MSFSLYESTGHLTKNIKFETDFIGGFKDFTLLGVFNIKSVRRSTNNKYKYNLGRSLESLNLMEKKDRL